METWTKYEATWETIIHSPKGKVMRAVPILAAILFGSVSALASDNFTPLNQALQSSTWKAVWIACPDAPERDPGVFYFRKSITLASVPLHFWVHISADNRFILHVNGMYAGEGPARGDVLHWRFETIDLSPYLRKGTNTLAAVVWNSGTVSPLAQMSYRTAFLLQGDTSSEELVNTGSSWLVKQERGRTPLLQERGAPYSSAGIGERIDGTVLDSSWDRAEVAAFGGWQAAVEVNPATTRGAPDSGEGWNLIPDALPPMERKRVDAGSVVRVEGLSEAPAFPNAPLQIPAHMHVVLLLDHKVLQTAYLRLVVSSGKGSTIRTTYAEALYGPDGKKGNRNQVAGHHIEGISDIFVSGGGNNVAFDPLWWRTWRYLQLEITTEQDPLNLESLGAWFTAYPFVERASISGNIEDLDQIWTVGWRTARLSAHETYMDAPYWEQLQYVGDARIEALISYAVAGDSRLARQALEAIDSSKVSEGLTQSRYPSSVAQFIPPFSLLWIGMLHDYWMYVDDPHYVEGAVPHTRDIADWYIARLRPNGFLGKMEWWNFGDWTTGYARGVPPQDPDGESTLSTLQFIEGLTDAIDLERAFGNHQRVKLYEDIIRKASQAINNRAWANDYGLYADAPSKKSYSQQVNVLAVMLNVAPRSRQAAILRHVLGSREDAPVLTDGMPVPRMSQVSYYFRFYLNRALDHAGLGDLYTSQLGPWRQMLSLGLSTWAETPEPTRSDCHAWSASPNFDLLTIVAGIRPAAPGFAKVSIAPHLSGLNHLEASMPSPRGMIEVAYRLEARVWLATITLPGDMMGSLTWRGRNYALRGGRQTLELQCL